jgi:hypothetical protein
MEVDGGLRLQCRSHTSHLYILAYTGGHTIQHLANCEPKKCQNVCQKHNFCRTRKIAAIGKVINYVEGWKCWKNVCCSLKGGQRQVVGEGEVQVLVGLPGGEGQ